MKKYHQLLLLITSIVSLSLLLVYRHEYNRLHYVLEVFNFFGQSCNLSDFQLTDPTLKYYDWGAEPVWQKSENVYVYSAFWNGKEAKSLVIQPDQTELARNCYLWFEDKQKPVIGKFKYTRIAQDKRVGHVAYFYYCMLSSLEHSPYAISFSIKNKQLKDSKKILLTTPVGYTHKFNNTICISPTDFQKQYFIEFLSYHKLVGVDNFIFYTNNIPHRLAKIISNLSSRLGIKVVFLLWNYPLTEDSLTRSIIEHDCRLRTNDFSRYSITLEINEFIVSSNFHTLVEFVDKYDSKNLSRLSLPVQVFCVEHNNHRKPIVLQNTDVNYNGETIIQYIYRSNHNDDVVNTQAIVKDIVSIHKYMKCLQKPVRMYQDDAILKFSTDLIRSTLIQLLLRDQI